ncbi:hypothetical protein [Streptosporangium lutulentum]|uniref:GNAT family N-acetyltransferase n=1 Tax=Streptosporangium lutulentum TaxID=1461250 RepID=A0ABT9Q7G0_9ACTN|nr:hypothetical protein [Streptosporangium lutulentum]MDP9842671.1 hypothetical protein [Streptosporangium lutulentum]
MYRVEHDPEALAQLDALPVEALPFYLELRAALETAPWGFPSASATNPDGPLRSAAFGDHKRGLAFFLILEDQRRVAVVKVLWAG